jgi:hypothetical protein
MDQRTEPVPEAIIHALSNGSHFSESHRPLVVAVGLPVAAMQQTIRTVGALAQADSDHPAYPEGFTQTLPRPLMYGIISDDDVTRVLEDIRVDMAATVAGMLAAEPGPVGLLSDEECPGEPIGGDSPDSRPVADWPEDAFEVLNQAVPTGGWCLPNIGVVDAEAEPTPVNIGPASKPESRHRPTRPSLLIVNDRVYGATPPVRTVSGEGECLARVSLVAEGSDVASSYRKASLACWEELAPATSHTPPRVTLIQAAREYISGTYADLLTDALDGAPISRRRAHAGGRPRGGRPPAPTLEGAEPFLILAAIEGEATRREVTKFCTATGVASQSTVYRTGKALETAEILTTYAAPSSGRGQSSSLFHLGLRLKHVAADAGPVETLQEAGRAYANNRDA